MAVVPSLVLLLAAAPKPASAKIRNVDAEVLQAVIAPFAGGRSRPNRREVYVLWDQLHSHARPAFYELLTEIDDVLSDESGVTGTRLARQRAERKRLVAVMRDKTLLGGGFVPPPILPLRTLDLGPQIVVENLRSRGVMYGRVPLPGKKSVFASGRGSVSAPTYSSDGRYAAICLTHVAGLHPFPNYFLLRREATGWTVVAYAEVFMC